MDTISRENNTSYLPIAGVLVGVLALIVAAAALIKVSSLGKRVPANLPDQIASAESNASSAAQAADKANRDIVSLTRSTQVALDSIGPEIVNLKTAVAQLEDASKARTAAPKAAKGAPVVAGPGEYVVKPGDTGVKIARALGVSLGDLQSVNQNVEWNRLHIGQKIKVPGKQ